MDRKKVLLASRSRSFRQSLRRIFETELAVDVAAEVGDGFNLLKAVRHFSNGTLIVVLDIPFPHVPWPEAIKKIKSDRPGTIAVVVGPGLDDEYVNMAIEAGADRYVMRENIDVELPCTIDSITREIKHARMGLADVKGLRRVINVR
jgi:DNA-binding NarL/FixJ family response regulator